MEVDGVEHNAPDVVLALRIGGIPDPYRLGAVVARQVVKHLLVGSVPEVDLWVHRDGNPEIVAQITPDQAAVLRAAGWSDEWPEVDSDA